MATAERERKSRRLFMALILVLILGYAVVKSVHISTAMTVYKGQVLERDTTGAAK